MLVVRKLVGEGIDFATGKQYPKALILSNGVNDMSLYVDDETAERVIKFMLLTGAEVEVGEEAPAPQVEKTTPENTPESIAQTFAPFQEDAAPVEAPSSEGDFDDPDSGLASV